MNRFERSFGVEGEAQLKYLSGEYTVIIAGAYVICAVTGRQIPLEELCYWSAEHQEAYVSPEAALQRYQRKS